MKRVVLSLSGLVALICLCVFLFTNRIPVRTSDTISESKPLPRDHSPERDARGSGNVSARVETGAPAAHRGRTLILLGTESIPKALEFIQREYAPHERQNALSFLLRRLGENRLDAISEVGPLITDKGERMSVFHYIANHWAKHDAEKLLQFAGGVTKPIIKNEFLVRAGSALAEKRKFSEAVTAISMLPFSHERSGVIRSLAGNLAAVDPLDAVAWAKALPVKEDSEAAQQAILYALPSGSLEKDVAALRALAETAHANHSPGIYAKIGKLLGEGGLESLGQEAVLGLDKYGQILMGAMETLPDAELPRALALADRLNEHIRDRVVSEYVERLFLSSPEKAASWVATSPSAVREAATSSLVSRWYQADSRGASDWVSKVPTGSDRDVALYTLAIQLRHHDSEGARKLAEQITDARKRDAVLQALR